MAGMVLKLAPGEEFYLNGSLFENGDRRTRITLKSRGGYMMRRRIMIPDEQSEHSDLHRFLWKLGRVMAQLEPDTPRDISELHRRLLAAEPQIPEGLRKGVWVRFANQQFYPLFTQLKGLLPTTH